MNLIWIFNLLLYVIFNLNQPLYRELVSEGQPCWIQVDSATLPIFGLGNHLSHQPICWYDPSNQNDGHLQIWRSK